MLRNLFSCDSQIILESQYQGPTDLSTLAPEWRWTGKKLFQLSNNVEIYSLAAMNNRERTALIKIYRTNQNSTAQQSARNEKYILEQLQGKSIADSLSISNEN